MALDSHFDTIIVGGRPAGSTLAARLGTQGLRVLLLERAVFPSPHPASSPIIYASAMQLLDEISADENAYAHNTPRITRWANEFIDQIRTFTQVPAVFGRDYGYAIDRARFDHALWQVAARCPTVTARQPFVVEELIWKDETVIGIKGRAPGSPVETFTADCVVGADGRFSTVARKVGAQIYDARTDLPTTVYYASWQGAEPYDGLGAVVHFCKPSYGYFFLLLDSADNLTYVVIEGQAQLFAPQPGQVEAFYQSTVRRHPLVWRRLAHAQQVGGVHGMHKVGNFYRAASGPGWALVGDALHQKDSADGQGIYDALFSAKALSQALVVWKKEGQPWKDALADYDSAVRAETYPMYLQTLEQVKRDVYTQSPVWLDKLLQLWLGADPEINQRFALLAVRGISPKGWLPASTILRAVIRGALSNAAYFLKRQPHPALFPALPCIAHTVTQL